MKEELLEVIRDDYFEKINQNDKRKRNLEILKTRKSFLENSPIIKQYMDLEKQIDVHEQNIRSDELILEKLLNFYAGSINDKDSNDIFIYLGSFVYDMHNNEIQLNRNDDTITPDYNLYANIESADYRAIDYADYEKFEREHNVIIVSDFPNIRTFYDIRSEFFKDAFSEGQEKAVSKVLKRNIKK